MTETVEAPRAKMPEWLIRDSEVPGWEHSVRESLAVAAVPRTEEEIFLGIAFPVVKKGDGKATNKKPDVDLPSGRPVIVGGMYVSVEGQSRQRLRSIRR